MIKHIWSVLCKESAIDKDSNNVSLHSALGQLNIPLSPEKRPLLKEKPINIPINYEVVSFWVRAEKGKEKFDVQLTLINPEGKEIQEITQHVATPRVKRIRTRFRIAGFPVQQSGEYVFRVSFKSEGMKTFKRVAEIPLEVKITNIPSKPKH